MSELIQKNDNCATIRWKLLTGASALALIASSPAMAGEPPGHSLIWIEVGADADALSGLGDHFTAPFLEQTPTPGPFTNGSPLELQKPPRFTFGGEGSISFQPEESDWIFSAGIRYGRSSKKRDVHHQTQLSAQFDNPQYHFQKFVATRYPSFFPSVFPNGITAPPTATKVAQQYAETGVVQSESHLLLDFQAGKDVGLGMFGKSGTSILSGGVRVARFTSHADVTVRARPNMTFYNYETFRGKYQVPTDRWSDYYLHGRADRSFNGVGPSLSWSASAPIAGNVQDGQLSIDWGVNGALLFGRQRAKVSHHTTQRDFRGQGVRVPGGGYYGHLIYYFTQTPNSPPPQNRSRNVTVPNLGANIGLTYRIENTKVSLGYRTDNFFGAMDGGIDAAKRTSLSFNGIYASVSVGLGD